MQPTQISKNSKNRNEKPMKHDRFIEIDLFLSFIFSLNAFNFAENVSSEFYVWRIFIVGIDQWCMCNVQAIE